MPGTGSDGRYVIRTVYVQFEDDAVPKIGI